MKTYQLQLLKCNNHNIEISRYLQILTRIEKEDADRIVSNVPVVLYDNLDEECAGYFEEALDYYQAEYEIQPMPEECDIQKFPSRQVIVLGRVMEYFGQRSDFVQLARKYDFSRKTQLTQTPFVAKDGLNKEQAVKLCQEFTNIGMRAQIVRSKKKPVPIEEKKKRLSMELGVYSILLLWLGISGKGNAVLNTIVTMLFILYNLENMFCIMPSKIEMMQAKTVGDGKIIQNQELKPLKKMDAEKYKKEYLKKIRKSNRSYLLIYTGMVYVVVLLILIIVPKERFIAGMLFYILCYFIGLFALMFNNKHKIKKIKEKNFENVNYGEGRIINSKEIEYLDNQGENKIINYPDGMNKKKTAGDNVNIIVADGRIMEIK